MKSNDTIQPFFWLLFLFFHFQYAVLAQSQPENRKVNTYISKDHQRLGSSNIFIVPPSGFTGVSGLNGIMKQDANASLIVLEIPGSFEEVTALFGAKAMREKNIDIKTEENLTFNNNRAYFIDALQKTAAGTYAKYVLSFAAESTTVILNATMPIHQADSLGEIIKKAMFSAVYMNAVSGSLSSPAIYEIDIAGTSFQLARSASNSMVYTTDGKMPTSNPEKTALLTTRSEGRLEFKNKLEFAKERLNQLPAMAEINIKEQKETTVNGMEAVEILAYGNDIITRETKMIYQLMCFKDFTYYLVIGTCIGNFESNLEQFRKVAFTLQLR